VSIDLPKKNYKLSYTPSKMRKAMGNHLISKNSPSSYGYTNKEE